MYLASVFFVFDKFLYLMQPYISIGKDRQGEGHTLCPQGCRWFL